MDTNGAELFTFVSLPEPIGKFPTVIYRSPYVDDMENMKIEEIIESYRGFTGKWTEHGQAR